MRILYDISHKLLKDPVHRTGRVFLVANPTEVVCYRVLQKLYSNCCLNQTVPWLGFQNILLPPPPSPYSLFHCTLCFDKTCFTFQSKKSNPRRGEYNVYSTFQSHEPEFDYLKSLEIEEKINKIRWLKRKNPAHFLLSTNGKLRRFRAP